MTPKEKAIELVHKFCSTTEGFYKSKNNIKNAKYCASICCDEIIKELDSDKYKYSIQYWQEVKKEIEKL